MQTMRIVGYLRVSTDAQAASGLGIEAQRAEVARLVASRAAEFIAEVIETESGAKNDRPELARALALCRKHKATLCIARLDRLGRNASFLLSLRDAGVPIVCCDMPHADKLYFEIRAVVAEEERDLISRRTAAALAAAKARGVRLGNPRPEASAARGRAAQAAQADSFAQNILPLIASIKAAGLTSLAAIATALNARGIATARGGSWHACTVANIIARAS